jgi:signal-transduction protein with cAMP-binding, CBS, and nucleotidyltransferase domain
MCLQNNPRCVGLRLDFRGYRCPYCWKIGQDRLKSAHHRIDEQRQKIQDDLDRQAQSGGLMSSWTEFVDILLADLYGEHSAKQPCRFAFCVCGSLARTEACPWSDIDAFILTEHSSKSIKDFFRNASIAVERQLTFGRPNQWDVPTGKSEKVSELFFAKTGFQFCTGNLSPLNDDYFINTPEEMLGKYEDYLDEPHYRQSVLQTRARFVFGHEPLFNEWAKILGEHVAPDRVKLEREALAEMRELADRPLPNVRGDSIDVKKELYRPVQLILHSLALNYGINELNPRREADALVHAGYMTSDVARLFKETLDGIGRLRTAGHLNAMDEDRGHVYFLNNKADGEGVLATPQQKSEILRLIENLRKIKKLSLDYFEELIRPALNVD